ncbi:MAG: hypothetical protein V2G43_04865 [bacterium JZ-2024 1]
MIREQEKEEEVHLRWNLQAVTKTLSSRMMRYRSRNPDERRF